MESELREAAADGNFEKVRELLLADVGKNNSFAKLPVSYFFHVVRCLKSAIDKYLFQHVLGKSVSKQVEC